MQNKNKEMNIFDDMKADQNRIECQHLWILRRDMKSIFCDTCGLEKEIHEGTKLEE